MEKMLEAKLAGAAGVSPRGESIAASILSATWQGAKPARRLAHLLIARMEGFRSWAELESMCGG